MNPSSSTISPQLIIGLIFIQLLCVLYAMSVISSFLPMQMLTLASLILLTIFLFIIQRSDNYRLALFIGIMICTTWLNLPLENDALFGEVASSISLTRDRIQIRWVPMIIFSILFFLRVMYILIDSKPRLAALSLGAISLFIFVLSWHDYQMYSIYQVIIDFFYLLGAFSVFLYMRFVISDNAFLDLYPSLISIMLTLFIFIILDLIAVILGIGTWSWSWRDGLQGFFYGNEVAYSFILGIAFVFIISHMKSFPIKMLALTVGIYLLYLTQIESGIYALILSLVALSNNFTRFINGKVILLSILCIALYFFAFVDLLDAEKSSLFTRAMTYYIAFSLLADGWWFLGIKPGVMDIMVQQNLAIMIFEQGFADLVEGLPAVLSDELLMRSSYETGTPILPHNTAIALFSSYGLILLLPIIYYYFLLPYKIVTKLGKSIPSELFIIGRLFLYILLFSYLHPISTPIILIFFGELSRMTIKRSGIDYE